MNERNTSFLPTLSPVFEGKPDPTKTRLIGFAFYDLLSLLSAVLYPSVPLFVIDTLLVRILYIFLLLPTRCCFYFLCRLPMYGPVLGRWSKFVFLYKKLDRRFWIIYLVGTFSQNTKPTFLVNLHFQLSLLSFNLPYSLSLLSYPIGVLIPPKIWF